MSASFRWQLARRLLAPLAAGAVLGAAAPALASPPSAPGAPDAPLVPTPAILWEPSMPAPPGYHVERRMNRNLVIAGAVMFGVAYIGIVVPSLIIAANGSPLAAVVTVPVGGPIYFVPGALRTGTTTAGLVVFDALVQAAGVGMLIGGLAGKRVTVPGPPPRSTVQFAPVPLRFGSNGAGIAIAGTF